MRASVGFGVLLAAAFLGGCGTEQSSDDGATRVVDCEGDKCDDTTLSPPPVLQAVSLAEIGSCRGVLDTSTTDSFFQLDRVVCRFDTARIPGLQVFRIYASASPQGAPGADSTTFEAAQLDGREVTIGQVYARDAYPLQIDVTVSFAFPADATGSFGDTHSRGGSSLFYGARMTLESRSVVESRGAMRVSLPFDLRPVVLWPDADLQATWAANRSTILATRMRYGFDVTSGELIVGGPSPISRIDIDRQVFVRKTTTPSLTPLTTDVVYLPVPRGVELGEAGPALEITSLGETRTTARTLLPTAGYYVVSPSGDAALTPADQLPALSDPSVPPPPVEPPPVEPPPVEPPPPPVEPPPPAPVDPCAGACTAVQACVAGRCIDLTRQTQSSSCYAPTATCDANENQDCAADHACVAGYCRRLTCQTQSSSCYAPTAACDAGDDGDCGAEHACVAGLCRRLTCQTQSSSCYAPTAVCDGDDGDCGADHACAGGLCRRLTCQSQSSSCYAPTAVCDEGQDSDCAPDHACTAGVCRRVTCR